MDNRVFYIEWNIDGIVSNVQGWMSQIFPYSFEESMKDSRTEFNRKLYSMERSVYKVFRG